MSDDLPSLSRTESEVHRLDGSAQPTAYELLVDLEPHVLNAQANGPALRQGAKHSVFEGLVKIYVTARSNLRAITLHALELDIFSISWAIRGEADHFVHEEPTVSPRSVSQSDDPASFSGQSFNQGSVPNNSLFGDDGDRSQPLSRSASLTAPPTAHPVDGWKLDDAHETLRFDLGQTIAENRQIVVFIKYRGRINSKSTGLFQSDDNDDFALATHLEPTNARRLYPCFDEPAFPARFNLSVRIPDVPGYVLLSNTREFDVTTDSGTSTRLSNDRHSPSRAASFRLGGASVPAEESPTLQPQPASLNYATVTFYTTPPIPTYLVAFVFARLHSVEAETTNKVITRVFLPVSQPLENAWFTLDLLKKAVEFFEGYFDYPLPMKKLDVVSVGGLSFLGMENWGLLIFHNDYVAVSEVTPLERQQRIARLVGHEVAHQWFGNLVSLRWWRYIWLKEGLARFLEYVFVCAAFPKWDMWLNFIADIQNVALKADSIAKTRHPVEQAAGLHPRQVIALFDTISYGKAASIMRMISSCLGGEGAMSLALKQFVHRHAWSSATSEDLYVCFADILQRASSATPNNATNVVMTLPRHLTVEKILNKWVSTVGPAYLFVTSDEDPGELVAPLGKPFAEVKISCYSSPDLSVGFTATLGNRPTSPREQARQEHGDPLSRGVDRSNRSTRPSSMQIVMHHTLKPMDLPVPIFASAYAGRNMLNQTFVGVCEGVDNLLSVSLVAAEGEHIEGPVSIIINPNHIVPCRVDYDTALWWRIVESVGTRPVKERLSIAISLFELRTTLVGVLDPADQFDRCMLLLRFIYDLGANKETHAIIWGYVSEALSTFITLIQDHPCWLEVRLLLIFAHRHLMGSVIGFPATTVAKDPVLDYKAAHDLSARHRCSLLQTMARCGEPDTVAEAIAYTEWILAAFCGPSQATALGMSHGGSFTENTLNLDGTASAPPMVFTVPSQYADTPCDLQSLPMEYVAIAFETAIANSDSSRLWWATAQLLSFVIYGDVQSLNLSVSARQPLPAEVLAVDSRHVHAAWISRHQQEWTDALMPAVLACPLSDARAAQVELLSHFSTITDTCLRALFENSNLLTKFLEESREHPPDKHLLRAIKRFALDHSANALVATWLAENTNATRQDLFKNCIWADYVNEHYAWYIRRHLIRQVAPADASIFSEIASKSLTGSTGLDSTPDAAMKMKGCSV
jgi:hypothetical protein